jgi:S1-C subfamily serine protease
MFRKGKQKVKKVVLGNWPGAPRVASGRLEGEKESSNKFGVRVSPLSHRIKNQFRIEGDEGVVVSSIKPDSPAEKSSLRIGDRIVKVNGKKVTSVRQFQKLLKSGRRSLIYVERSGQHFFVSLIS